VLAWGEQLLRIRWIAEVRAVVDADAEAGGSLLSAALAYRALFGLLSGLILVAGLIGWAFDDPAARASAVEAVAGIVPGLEPIVSAGLERLVAERGTLSLLGLIGAAFGASIFYDALDDSMNRVMPGGGQRNPILRRALGTGGVILLAVTGVAALGIGIAMEPASGTLSTAGQVALAVLRPFLIVGLLAFALGAIYRWVPILRPTWVDIRLPAVVIATAIWLASEIFGLIAPLIVRQLAVFGVFVSLLALLIWLSWVTQLLVVGGSWSRVRRDARVAISLVENRSDDRNGLPPRAADHS
jgi:uncharacterized BrkB/YihY/UPF0761 family membrane protein